MSKASEAEIWEILEQDISQNENDNIIKLFEKSTPAETARLIAHLNEDSRQKLLLLLNPDNAASLLHSIPDEQAADIIEKLPVPEAVAIIDQMPADEQADILADVKAVEADAILEAMPHKDSSLAREIMEYPDDTAGAMMSFEFLAYNEDATCGALIEDLQTHQARYSDFDVQYAYIISSSRRLKGVLRMRDLILAKKKHTGSVLDDQESPSRKCKFRSG